MDSRQGYQIEAVYAFEVSRRVNNPGNKSRQRVVQEREPLGRLHRFMLFFSGESYFVQSIVIQDANDKEMQAQIRIVTQVLCDLPDSTRLAGILIRSPRRDGS